MRDVRVASLPKTAAWRRVVERLAAGADARALVVATLDAAPLSTLARDAVLQDAVATIARLSSGDARSSIRSLGVVPRGEGRMSLVAAIADALDARASELGRTDVGELAQLAAIEALVRAPPGPLDAIDERRFVSTLCDTFARLVERWVLSWLERELPSHVGEGARFATLDDQARFREALSSEIRGASATVEPIARALLRERTLDDDDLRAFDAEALLAIDRALRGRS